MEKNEVLAMNIFHNIPSGIDTAGFSPIALKIRDFEWQFNPVNIQHNSCPIHLNP
jgi:hypothetical protein